MLDRYRDVVAGRTTLGAVNALFGTRLDSADPGRIVGRIPEVPADGLPGVGAALLLADVLLTGAVGSTLDPTRRTSTLTLHASGLGVPIVAGAELTATADLVAAGPDWGLSQASINSDGVPALTVLARVATMPKGPEWGAAGPGEAVDRAGFAPMHRRTVRRGEASVTEFAAIPASANMGGTVHGGVLAAFVATALDHALDTARPRLTGAPTELDVTYVRAVPTDGATVAVTAGVVHAGSRFASARAELHDATGRLAVFATAARWRG